MKISRDEALKAVDDIFNYCEEIDNSLPENERSGYKMLPDIHKIRKYIIENERPHGEWKPLGEPDDLGIHSWYICSRCGFRTTWHMVDIFHFCPNCGSDNRKEGDEE
jgi:rubrerythrin